MGVWIDCLFENILKQKQGNYTIRKHNKQLVGIHFTGDTHWSNNTLDRIILRDVWKLFTTCLALLLRQRKIVASSENWTRSHLRVSRPPLESTGIDGGFILFKCTKYFREACAIAPCCTRKFYCMLHGNTLHGKYTHVDVKKLVDGTVHEISLFLPHRALARNPTFFGRKHQILRWYHI